MGYQYELGASIVRDVVEKQGERLVALGFRQNEELKTWDRYKERYEEKHFFDLEYSHEVEVNVPTSEYEIQEIDNEAFRVTYIDHQREKGFFGFFRKLFHVRTKEELVSDARYNELLLLQTEGVISGLEKIITPTVHKKQILLTEKQFLTYFKTKKPIRLVRENVGETKEKQLVFGSTSVEKKDFEKFSTGKDILSKKERLEKILVDKVLVEQREVVEMNYQYYQPGVWSRQSVTHPEGTLANFVANVTIRYISGFNPFDPDFIDRLEIADEIRENIKYEHSMAEYIQKRNDRRDGFNIEKGHISQS